MIRLQRAEKPDYLTDERVDSLTQKFINDKTSVWNNDHIKTPLLGSSYKKCAYYECDLTKESNYMEVEHFEDKAHNKNKVVEWTNLLPSCKKCNGKKGTHDVIFEPIVNPYIDNPSEHLYIKDYRIKWKTNIGKKTIGVVGLNATERLLKIRFDIGNKLHETIEKAYKDFNTYLANTEDTENKNDLLGFIEKILFEYQKESSYSATTSTIIHSNDEFNEIITYMKENDLWNDEFESLYESSKILVLEKD